MNDYAHSLTDKELALLELKIRHLYREAADDMSEKITEYFAHFQKRDEKQKALVDAGKLSEQDYKLWRLAQIGRGKRMEALRDQLADRMTNANEVAASYINDLTPGIYSLNRNYAAYTIEQVAGDVGFDIWDESTVRRLIVENPISMPYYPIKRAIDRNIDLAWGQQQITRQITTGILQGESIGKIANRLQEKIPDMNRVSAVRAARTAMTSAQNAGRMDSYVAAQKMGIKLRREWVATLDNRTRHAHAILDGQKADIGKPFEVEGQEIMFPGDPHAHPSLVYNCRCTLIAAVDGADMSDAQRRARNPETGRNELISNMSYQEWEEWKKELANSGDSDILKSDISNGFKVTRATIDSIPAIDLPGYSAEVSKRIHEECKALLEIVMHEPVGTEAGIICDVNGIRRWSEIGPKGKGKISVPTVPYDHVFIHNHPSGEIFSHKDIENFILKSEQNAIIALGNNGSIFAAVKTADYDGFVAFERFTSVQLTLQASINSGNQEEYIYAIKRYLAGGDDFGVEFIERAADVVGKASSGS